jgi:hypothetical protein
VQKYEVFISDFQPLKGPFVNKDLVSKALRFPLFIFSPRYGISQLQNCPDGVIVGLLSLFRRHPYELATNPLSTFDRLAVFLTLVIYPFCIKARR